VAMHPGDKGMEMIATRIAEAILKKKQIKNYTGSP